MRTAPADDVVFPATVPLVPVKDLVIFPFMIVPLNVARAKSARAIEASLNLSPDRMVFLVAQRDAGDEDPAADGLHAVGCLGVVLRMNREAGRVRVLVQGLARARIKRVIDSEPCFVVEPEPLPDLAVPEDARLRSEALMRASKENVDRLVKGGGRFPEEVALVVQPVEAPGRLADLIASNLRLGAQEALDLLAVRDPMERLRAVNGLLEKELGILEMRQQIEAQAREQISRTQREYFLRQQLRAIRTELGDENLDAELETLRLRVEQAGMSHAALTEARRQVERLSRLNPDSTEAGVLRHHLERLLALPWMLETPDDTSMPYARAVLDADHDGLERIKERVLEHLAVRTLRPDARSPILCFVGPPGVGKTSLARSIARALGRRCARISLGGVRDEAAVRGHRRTYVGAMPGRIVQALEQSEARNPVIILDELDKLGLDGRGDPAAALLEVLDPALNHAFRDHFLDVPIDLSRVLFVATANVIDTIPGPLRDRVELIRLSGYTEDEKLRIARRHIIPRAIDAHGLTRDHLILTDDTVRRLVRDYTHEAGLRTLERHVAALCRKVARKVAEGKTTRTRIGAARLTEWLGPPRPPTERLPDSDEVGTVIGLAWTQAGGSIVVVEATCMRGGTGLKLTGQLGEVMKESAHAGLSFLRARAAAYGLNAEAVLANHEVHVHVPAGAIAKDGPSAGVTIATAIASVLLRAPVRNDVAMTGEITLRGHVLPVGGLKEKLLAAVRAGLRTVLVPEGNMADLRDLPPGLRRKLRVVPCRHVEDVFREALVRPATAADVDALWTHGGDQAGQERGAT